ncbi:MAG: L,D-transpeptidase family protein [Bacteroidetes bacterium]|nr:L,D-transpeptidase family protein [Bacteroidota bacterium]
MRMRTPHNRSVYIVVTLFLISLSFLFPSCRSKRVRNAHKGGIINAKAEKFNESDVADELEKIFSGTSVDDSIWQKGKIFNISRVMQKAYSEEEYYPIWLTDNGDTSYVASLLQELNDTKFDGLNPEDYNAGKLRSMLNAYKAGKNIGDEEVIRFDTLCTRSYLQASKDLLLGKIVPAKADSLWFHANDSVWRPYISLAKMGSGKADYPTLDSFRSRQLTYKLLRNVLIKYNSLPNDSAYVGAKAAAANGILTDSVKDIIMRSELPWDASVDDSINNLQKILTEEYQYYLAYTHSKGDSIVKASYAAPINVIKEKIDVNMERLRWMKQNPESLYVLVNVPLLQFFLRIDGNDAMNMQVVVGKTIRQTPSLNANLANVVINPPWAVPPTIMKKDVLPGLLKSGQAYLSKKGLKVYDMKGKEVSPNKVTATNYKRFVFRQDPGDDNALGNVKFNLPNKWDIYMHDTPHREDFGKKDRFKSSGCIRLQRPRELAEFILSDLEGKYFTQGKLDTMIQTRKTRYEVLAKKIPVHIVYLTAFEDSTHTRVHFIPDVYGRDPKLASLLK